MASKPKTSPYDSTAVVKRVEDGVAWVQIPGGVDETPVKLTVNAEAGDTVQVRVSGGTAFLVGNATAPPTDDTKANAAQKIAVTAQKTADGAVEDAERAKNAADDAERSAESAQVSANNANEYASRALSGLSTVQSVAETLTWITQHGTMTLTTDTEIDPTHVYFVQDAEGDYVVGNVHYSVVAEPKAADLATYYVLSIDESLNNYVATHLALTSEGLWVVPDSSGYKVLISTGVSDAYKDAGIYIIGSGGEVVARFLTSRTTLTSDGGLPVLDISSNGTTEEITITRTITKLVTHQVALRPLPKTGKSVVVRYYYYVGDDIHEGSAVFIGGTSRTDNISGKISISYTRYSDSGYDRVYLRNLSARSCGLTGVEYKVDAELPVFTLGTRDESEGVGGFSATIGEGLIASKRGQTVVGTYNEDDTGDDYVFIAGNGTSDTNRSNAFAVGRDGNVEAGGQLINYTAGSSGGWTWRKYADGTLDLWGTFAGTSTPYSSTVNSWYPHRLALSFPANAKPNNGDYSVWQEWEIGTGFTMAGPVFNKSASGCMAYVLAGAQGSLSYTARFYIHGTWK